MKLFLGLIRRLLMILLSPAFFWSGGGISHYFSLLSPSLSHVSVSDYLYREYSSRPASFSLCFAYSFSLSLFSLFQVYFSLVPPFSRARAKREWRCVLNKPLPRSWYSGGKLDFRTAPDLQV